MDNFASECPKQSDINVSKKVNIVQFFIFSFTSFPTKQWKIYQAFVALSLNAKTTHYIVRMV